jgi:hypothetical protein
LRWSSRAEGQKGSDGAVRGDGAVGQPQQSAGGDAAMEQQGRRGGKKGSATSPRRLVAAAVADPDNERQPVTMGAWDDRTKVDWAIH